MSTHYNQFGFALCGAPIQQSTEVTYDPGLVTCVACLARHVDRAPEKAVEVVKGATRSEIAPSFHLVPRQGLTRIATRYQLGAKQHGPENWKKAAETPEAAAAWCQQVYNHMMVHMLKMQSGDFPEDDHLGAIGWAQTQLCWFEEKFGCKWTDIGR